MCTLSCVVDDFPCLISSQEYQNLKKLVNTKIKILEKHEVRTVRKQGSIFRKNFKMLAKSEEKNRERSESPMLTQASLTKRKNTSFTQHKVLKCPKMEYTTSEWNSRLRSRNTLPLKD